MRKYMPAAVICGCLLIGSLYPRLLLEHHVKLVDEFGKEMEIEDEDELLFIRRYQSIIKNVVYPDQEKVKEILDFNYGILETLPNLILEKSGFFRDETSEL